MFVSAYTARRTHVPQMISSNKRCFVMKHAIARPALAAALAALFASGIVPRAEAQDCSNATLHGSFGYTSTGTLLDSYVPAPYAGPFAEIGRQNFDGKGNTQATATLSSNGNINKVTIEGTYTVNADCTGSMTVNIPALEATVHADFVIDKDGTEIRAVVTDSGVVESRVYEKAWVPYIGY
jgi:hypothetical protein